MKDHRRLAHYVAFGLLLCAATHAQASPPPPLSVTLGQKHLQLIDHQGRCALSEPDQSLRVLEMAWPASSAPTNTAMPVSKCSITPLLFW